MPKTVAKTNKKLQIVAKKTKQISKQKVKNQSKNQTKSVTKGQGAKVKSKPTIRSKSGSKPTPKITSNKNSQTQIKPGSSLTASKKSNPNSPTTGPKAQQQTIQRIRLSSLNQTKQSKINSMRRASALHKVVFVRHGQSTWNLENRFTGWHDVDLTSQGVEEAQAAGQLLKEHGFQFDLAHTSVLKRAIKTYNTISEEMGSLFIPHYKSWRLNERHYGALQGLNKAETAEKHGEEKVLQWRRSYDIPPPELTLDDERHPAFDRRYGDLPPDVLPCTESLKITVDRVLPYWYDTICPQVIQGKSVIVVAHGNSLRAIVKYLAGMSEQEILAYNIPTACPLVFEFDENMTPVKNYYLLDEEELKARQEAVANQAKVRV